MQAGGKGKVLSLICLYPVKSILNSTSTLKIQIPQFYYPSEICQICSQHCFERNMLHCKEKVDSQTLPELQLNKSFLFLFFRRYTSLNLYNETCSKRSGTKIQISPCNGKCQIQLHRFFLVALLEDYLKVRFGFEPDVMIYLKTWLSEGIQKTSSSHITKIISFTTYIVAQLCPHLLSEGLCLGMYKKIKSFADTPTLLMACWAKHLQTIITMD